MPSRSWASVEPMACSVSGLSSPGTPDSLKDGTGWAGSVQQNAAAMR